MAHINRKYIDKHWFIFIIRGLLAGVFGFLLLFGGLADLDGVIAMISIFLLLMGIVDSAGALYNSTKKHGWFNSIIDALIDILAALSLLFFARGSLVTSLVIISIYVFISGIIDIFHGFLSTVDPTDRFIRILAGVLGCLMGLVIINAGNFEVMTFIRFFGVYMLIVGITSMIYGAHNRAQNIEDKIARKESKKTSKTKRKK
ncbi:MAG: DUF308 domain-containing protein [Candidatus Saccharibacteria bacterium]|nr:DUF308 domain-containing protein [Candidatus Saccharibacteria bacterium]